MKRTSGDPAPPAARDKNYQLTHDYLVPSLRSWLTRKQKATRQGRAELRLADLASLWTAKPESRYLPSLLEFLQIRLFATAKAWNEGQRKMMTAAARYHALRGLAAMIVVLLIAIGSTRAIGDYLNHRSELYKQLYRVEIDKVPVIIDSLTEYRSWVTPRLRQDYDDAKNGGDEAKRLRASLALLPGDRKPGRLPLRAPDQRRARRIRLICQALLPYKYDLTEKLWGIVKSPRNDEQYLCAVSSLAIYVPDDPQWNAAASGAAAVLVRVNTFFQRYWTDALLGVQNKLIDPLSRIARDPAPQRQ